MIRHLFKLIWNQKKAHTLLVVEILASFLVLFGLTSLIVSNGKNYREPLGFSYERVWAINLNNNQDTAAVAQKTQAIFRRLGSYPNVESVSRMSDNYPFSDYYNGRGISNGNSTEQVATYSTDEHFAQTLGMVLAAGAWYRATDSIGKYKPVVINRSTQEALFGRENAVGKVIADYEKKPTWKVVGVVDSFKGKGEFSTSESIMFSLLDEKSPWEKTMLVRVKSGTNADFEATLVKDITTMLPGWGVEVTYLTDARQAKQNITLVPIVIFLIISGFLLINVALGLFGVLNVSITRRRGEIGLRRALGATEGAISRQIVGEMWVLATFALVLGLLLAMQFPLLHVFDLAANVYLTAMAVAAVVIYLLVTICALYPGLQAAKLQPAVALHEE